MTDVGREGGPAARREAVGVLNSIDIAYPGAGCAELGAVFARPRAVGVPAGPVLTVAETGGAWRGIGMTDAQAWPSAMDIPALALSRATAMSLAATSVADSPADEARHAAAPTEATIVALAERHVASAEVLVTGAKSAVAPGAAAHPNQLKARNPAFTRRHPDSRGPSPTEPPA
jgi:hypothetical protein